MNDSWLTDDRYQKFVSFLERASAARVVFYPFDAAGLRTESPFASLAFGRAPYVGLQFLAEQTGGAFVENTNDLGPEYRTIRVSANCKGCTVLARRGYRATTRKGLKQVGNRDVAPLLFLERGVAAADLPARMDVVLSTDGTRRLTRLAAEVAVASLAPGAVVTRRAPRVLTVLARVRGAGQRTIAVLSQHFDVMAASTSAHRKASCSSDLSIFPRGSTTWI